MALFLMSYVGIVAFGMWLFKKVGLPPVTPQTRQLEKTLDHQLEVNRRQTDFLIHVRHELRTPVTVALGTTQILWKHGDDLDHDSRQALREAAYRNAKSLGQLVEDLTVGVDEALPGLASTERVDNWSSQGSRRSQTVAEGWSRQRHMGEPRTREMPEARPRRGRGPRSGAAQERPVTAVLGT